MGHPTPAYIPGGYLVVCDRCGFVYRSYETRKEWTGLRVCEECWEERHPQDFVRGVRDDQTAHDPRPDPNMKILEVGDVTESNISTATASGTPIPVAGETFLSTNEVTEDDL